MPDWRVSIFVATPTLMHIQYRIHLQASWRRGTLVECQSLAGELSLSHARPTADE